MHVSKKALDEIEAALRDYEKEVELSNMTPSTKQHTFFTQGIL
jgi:hypothetical protein